MTRTASQSRVAHVPAGLYRATALFDATAGLWKLLARVESAVLSGVIQAQTIDRPIFVAGVPRSGSTLLTELVAAHPNVTSHRYSDFPNFWTPYWRNWLADRVGRDRSAPVERSHRDRIRVNRESPEAVEEAIWMQFFDHLHDPTRNQVLDHATENPAFERFYREHIAKLLAVRGATRYLAKGNYNATRLGYLLKLYPDARIVIPWREPIAQVASLVKQDRLFSRMAAEDPRVPVQLARSGHFEFGPGKRAVQVGDHDAAHAIEQAWHSGDLAEGWARYWTSIYGAVLERIETDPAVAAASMTVNYEALCREPQARLEGLFEHLGLDAAGFGSGLDAMIREISLPDYYRPDFSADELAVIESITDNVRARLTAAGRDSIAAG